jgi:hypothetical protein
MSNDGSVDLGKLYLEIALAPMTVTTRDLMGIFGAERVVVSCAIAELEGKNLVDAVYGDWVGATVTWIPRESPTNRLEALQQLARAGLAPAGEPVMDVHGLEALLQAERQITNAQAEVIAILQEKVALLEELVKLAHPGA